MRTALPAALLAASLLLAAGCDSAPETGVPSWVPAYPGVETQLLHEGRSPEGRTGTAWLEVEDDTDTVFDFYRREVDEAGMKARLAPAASNDQGVAQVIAHDEEETRGLTVTITPRGEGGVEVIVNFTESS